MTSRSATPSQPLLQPVRLGALHLPNRVLMAPMTRSRAQNAGLVPTDLMQAYYAQRASAGLIVSEGTWVNDQAIGFINVPGIYSEAQTRGWATVTEAVHTAGGRIISQLGHVGAGSHPDHFGGRLPAGPSAINPGERSFTPSGMKDTVTPRAFTGSEIAQTIADYRTAAANARQAGFDGLEVHAQGSQLIAQFLNPRLNQRTDAYGGDAERRAQFLFDILDAVTEVWDAGRVSVKISPYWTSGSAFVADEEDLADYDQVIKRLGGNSLAFLHLMGPVTQDITDQDRIRPFARYRAQYDGPIVANVGFNRSSGNAIIEQGVASAVSFGAPFIANPDLVDRFAGGHRLADGDRASFYAGGADGYIDYPAISEGNRQSKGSPA
ncbi:alkene reductase [Streptomyces lunalinharesii]|uniref:Alkene reductase n=1 Tax=Streptomyces lunalinharesii TaxID=333384 RepID=A0ABP6EKF3_9ACTN